MKLSGRSGSTDGVDLDRVGHFLSPWLQLRKAIKKALLSRQSPQRDHAFYSA
jgi:hypothetical protein